jgi:hypothetical protein
MLGSWTRSTLSSSGQYSRLDLSSVVRQSRGESSSSGRAGGVGCSDTAARHDLQMAAKRTRPRRDATIEWTKPRRSSGRSDHCIAGGELSSMLPSLVDLQINRFKSKVFLAKIRVQS